tara:strand:- start:2782 stop:3282 length:501 start_codon:yes stop_codon:yes gene_type:complete
MNIKINSSELLSTKIALKNQWMRKQLDIEIKTSEGSRYIDDVVKRKIKEYSLSSQKRRKFLMYCIRAKLESDYLLVTQIIKLVGISRAGAETMIKECEEANWIEVTRRNGNRRMIQASDITVETYADYCDWLYKFINELDMRNLSASISEIEKLEPTNPKKTKFSV